MPYQSAKLTIWFWDRASAIREEATMLRRLASQLERLDDHYNRVAIADLRRQADALEEISKSVRDQRVMPENQDRLNLTYSTHGEY